MRDKIDASSDNSEKLKAEKKRIGELESEIEMLKNEKNDKMREEEKKKAEEIMSLNVNMKEKIDQLKRN